MQKGEAHKKPIYGQKIVLPRFSFVKDFFQKVFWRICRPSPKKEKATRGSLAELRKIALCTDWAYLLLFALFLKLAFYVF